MATPGGPPNPFTQQQIQQMLQQEAQQRGMTMEQLRAFHNQQIINEAKKLGITPQEYVQRKQKEAFEQHQKQQQQGQQPAQGPKPGQPGQPGQGGTQLVQQQIPVNGSVEAKPEALAVAKYLRSQNLKTRTCILDGQRRDMFKVKRAFRALQSDAYKKARTKNQLLPEVTNDLQARQAVQLLPLSMLALRVSKSDAHDGHNHAKPSKEKRVKGLWTVKIERQQEFEPLMHYAWLYDPPQWKTKVYAGLTLVAVLAAVLFPLWPLMMRQGVWYLSVGALWVLGAFFAMAIVRLILFCLTVFTVSPGLWLFPNLFEDVGFFDSFKPLWGWNETKKKKAKSKKAAAGADEGLAPVLGPSGTANGNAVSSAVETVSDGASAVVTSSKRHEAPRVEEVEDD